MSTPPSNPNWQQIQQIQQQNQVFQQALASGKISQAQYNAAMAEQNRQLAALQGQYSPAPAPQPVVIQPGPQPEPAPSPQPAPTPAPASQPSEAGSSSVPTSVPEVPEDRSGWVTPQQVGVTFTTGSITQAEIDAYAARGKILVPDDLKLPAGAMVTGSKIEDGKISVSYKTKEQVEFEKELELDAPLWTKAGFGDLAGKALFPELPEGATLTSAEIKDDQLLYSYTSPADMQQLQVDADVNRLLWIQSVFTASGVREYNQAVADKTAEFNLLAPETKIAEIQKAIEQGRLPNVLEGLPSGTVPLDATFKGGQFEFKLGIDPEAVADKTAEFNLLAPETKIAEIQKAIEQGRLPNVLEGLPNQTILDVTYDKTGTLQFTIEPTSTTPESSLFEGWTRAVNGQKHPLAAQWLPKGEGLGFTVPAGYKIVGAEDVIIPPLPEATQAGNDWLGEGWTKPVKEPVKVTQYQLAPIIEAEEPKNYTDQSLAFNQRYLNVLDNPNPIGELLGIKGTPAGRGIAATIESLIISVLQSAEALKGVQPTGPSAFLRSATGVIYPHGIPQPPATVLGSSLKAVTTGDTSELDYLSKNLGYAAGTLIGDVLLSVGIGRIAAPITPSFADLKAGFSYVGSLSKQTATNIVVGTTKIVEPEAGIYLKSVVLPNMPKNYVQQTITKNITNPLKYNLANPVVDAATIIRNEAITINQRFLGITTPKIAQYTAPLTSKIAASQPVMFTENVLAPNIRNYGAFIAPTVQYYSHAYSSSTLKTYIDAALTPARTNINALANIAKYDLLNPVTDLALSLKGEAVTVAQRGTTIVGREAATFKYGILAPAVDEALNIPRDIISYGQRGAGVAARPFDFLKAYSSVNYGTYLKPVVIEAKGYGKIAAGKIRYDLDLPVQPSKVPHQYSEWDLTSKFKPYPEAPTTITAPTKNTATILDKPITQTTLEPTRFTAGTGAALDAAYGIGETYAADYVPSILSGVAPFPGTRKRQPTYEEPFYYAESPISKEARLPTLGAFSFIGLTLQTSIAQAFTNISLIKQAQRNPQTFKIDTGLNAQLASFTGQFEGLKTGQAVDAEQTQFFQQETLQRITQRSHQVTENKLKINLPPLSFDEKKLLQYTTRRVRRGKYRKGVWEFDIMEGPQVMKELF